MAGVQEAADKAVREFMDPPALARYLEVPLGTIYGWRQKGVGPVGIKVGKHIRYRRRDVEAWLDAQATVPPRQSA